MRVMSSQERGESKEIINNFLVTHHIQNTYNIQYKHTTTTTTHTHARAYATPLHKALAKRPPQRGAAIARRISWGHRAAHAHTRAALYVCAIKKGGGGVGGESKKIINNLLVMKKMKI